MTFEEALEQLYRLPRYGKSHGLERMQKLLQALGEPQQAFPSVLITGTNGKGSVARLCHKILSSRASVALFTSPHLYSFQERFHLGERMATEEELLEAFQAVYPHIQKLGAQEDWPSGFEAFTAMAFWLFRQWQVDCAVLEVGLGGRLDPTSLARPVATVITNIGDDHEGILGTSQEARLEEKMGILRPKVPVFSALSHNLQPRLEARARELDAPVYFLGRHLSVRLEETSWEGQRLQVTTHLRRHELWLPLVGSFQRSNLALALGVCDELWRQGWPISQQDVQRALKQVQWPARAEVLSTSPLVVLDVAHNRAAAEALVEALTELPPPPKGWHLLIGVSADKPAPDMLAILARLQPSRVIFSEASYRPYSAHKLLELGRVFQGAQRKVLPHLGKALREGLSHLSSEEGLLITGGLFFAAEARALLSDVFASVATCPDWRTPLSRTRRGEGEREKGP